MTLRVLGIDPGTAVTGYGLIQPTRNDRLAQLLECGVIRTNSRQPLWNRLDALHDGIKQLIDQHQPDTLVLEDIFYAKNVRTTVVLGHARGVILLAAAQAGIEVAEYSPATIKKTITGTGRASKSQVGFMIQRLLHLEHPPTPTDAADGVAIALTFLMIGKR